MNMPEHTVIAVKDLKSGDLVQAFCCFDYRSGPTHELDVIAASGCFDLHTGNNLLYSQGCSLLALENDHHFRVSAQILLTSGVKQITRSPYSTCIFDAIVLGVLTEVEIHERASVRLLGRF